MRAIRASNPFVQPALQAISKSLLCGGIRVRKASSASSNKKGKTSGAPAPDASGSASPDPGEETLDPLIRDLIDTEWNPFCKQLLSDVITYGFCVVALDTTRLVPYTRDPMDAFSRIAISTDEHGADRVYELTMKETRSNTSFVGLGLGIGGPDSRSQTALERSAPPMFVLEHHAPEVDGDLTSLCRTLIPLDAFMQTIMQCQVTVQLRNARPLLITATEKQNVESKQIARDMGGAGDSTIMHRDSSALAHRIHFEAKRSDAEALRAMNEQFAQSDADMNRSRIEQMNGAQGGWMQVMHVTPQLGAVPVNNAPLVINPVTGGAEFPAMLGARQFEGSMLPLPANTTLETTPEAKGAESYIVKMWEVFRDVTLMNLGVPPVLWGSTSSSVAGNLVVINTYNDTKHAYRVMLQTVLKYIFIWFFGANELAFELRKKTEHRQRVKDRVLKSVKETVTAVEDTELEDLHSRIEIALPGTLDIEMIANINGMGLLPFKTLAVYTAAYLGIPVDDLATEPIDPLTGRPMKEVQQEQFQREDQVMQNQARLQMSVKAPSKSGSGKQPAQKKPKTMASQGQR